MCAARVCKEAELHAAFFALWPSLLIAFECLDSVKEARLCAIFRKKFGTVLGMDMV